MRTDALDMISSLGMRQRRMRQRRGSAAAVGAFDLAFDRDTVRSGLPHMKDPIPAAHSRKTGLFTRRT
ncbi:hypothetical protein ADK54_04670 [Streptomyces sp. WM6378]|nr:hypothetical protein ADK54_04670 [Streptomyces sp. WM6378]